MSINDSGRNSLMKYSNENFNKKIGKSELIDSTNQNPSERLINLENLMEESMKQTDQYRLKFENSLIKQISNDNLKQFNPMKTNQLVQFPSRPKTPIELIGKSNENHLTNLITNSEINKSDGLFCLISFRISVCSIFRSKYLNRSIRNHNFNPSHQTNLFFTE